MLKQRGIEHKVLNAKYHELEAHIISQAGRYKAVSRLQRIWPDGEQILFSVEMLNIWQKI